MDTGAGRAYRASACTVVPAVHTLRRCLAGGGPLAGSVQATEWLRWTSGGSGRPRRGTVAAISDDLIIATLCTERSAEAALRPMETSPFHEGAKARQSGSAGPVLVALFAQPGVTAGTGAIVSWIRLLALLVALSDNWHCGAGLDNGLARSPPMGFNTWNGLQDNYNESVIVEIIDAMSEQLLPFGYEYVVLTEQGMPTTGPLGTGPRRASDTVFRVDERRFPNGMQFLAQHAHRRGMKFGL